MNAPRPPPCKTYATRAPSWLRSLPSTRPRCGCPNSSREIGAGTADFEQTDAIERAVRDLVAAGLLFRNDELVLPTRAALRFDELLEKGV